MNIAIASGKGGTGKTTVATSLALGLMETGGWVNFGSQPPMFIDCDVEAPNAHLYLYPSLDDRQEISIPVPHVDEEKCTFCGKCAEVCQYHAIGILGKKALVFPQLCHGCGSCMLICPEDAISEKPNRIGFIESGETTSKVSFAHGFLDVGQPMAVPIIRQLKKSERQEGCDITILDCPPGTSCPVVESIRGADFLLLVTEPTPFGLHDLKLAYSVGRELKIPMGVVINRDSTNQFPAAETFCKSYSIPVLMRIPFNRIIAEGLAKGIPLVKIHPQYAEKFSRIVVEIAKEVRK